MHSKLTKSSKPRFSFSCSQSIDCRDSLIMLPLRDTGLPPALMRQPHRSVTPVYVHYFQFIVSERCLVIDSSNGVPYVHEISFLTDREFKAAENFLDRRICCHLFSPQRSLLKGRGGERSVHREDNKCSAAGLVIKRMQNEHETEYLLEHWCD